MGSRFIFLTGHRSSKPGSYRYGQVELAQAVPCEGVCAALVHDHLGPVFLYHLRHCSTSLASPGLARGLASASPAQLSCPLAPRYLRLEMNRHMVLRTMQALLACLPATNPGHSVAPAERLSRVFRLPGGCRPMPCNRAAFGPVRRHKPSCRGPEFSRPDSWRCPLVKGKP